MLSDAAADRDVEAPPEDEALDEGSPSEEMEEAWLEPGPWLGWDVYKE